MANAIFPTSFTELTPVRSISLLADNGVSNGFLTVADILGQLQSSDGAGTTFAPLASPTFTGTVGGLSTATVTATGSSTLRSLANRFAESIDPLDYGVKFDGSTDDSTAWGTVFAALSTLSYGGYFITLPAGRSIINSTIAKTLPANTSVSFIGKGSGVSELYFPNLNDGLAITLASNSNFHIEGVSITRGNATGTSANTALLIAGTVPTSSQIVSVKDVVMKGNSGRTTSWLNGLVLSNISAPTITNCYSFAPDGNGSGTAIGFKIFGASTSSFCIDLKMYSCWVQGGGSGLVVGDYVQGVFITNSEFIGCDYGINWNVSTVSAEFLTVTNCHCNTYINGIYVNKSSEVMISNTLFLHFGAGTSWTAIKLVDTNNNTISNNLIYGTVTTGETGISLNYTTSTGADQPSTINGNSIGAINGKGIWLTGFTNMTTVMGNSMNGVLGGGVVNDNPSSNLTMGNLLNGSSDVTFSAGSLIVNGNTSTNTLNFPAITGNKIILFPSNYGFGVNGSDLASWSNGQFTFRNGSISGTTLASISSSGLGTFTGGLVSTGSLTLQTVTVTSGSSYTVLSTDYLVVINKTSGSATAITLPSSPATGRTVVIKDGKGDAATNVITISPAAGNIDGGSNYGLNVAYQTMVLTYSGTAWNIVSGYRIT